MTLTDRKPSPSASVSCPVDVTHGASQIEKEYRFHPSRKWRFDYAIPKYKIAIEIQGGIWTMGRHVRGVGYLSDMEKFNEAQLLGWIVLMVTPQQMKEKIYTILERALEVRGIEKESGKGTSRILYELFAQNHCPQRRPKIQKIRSKWGRA